MFRENNDDNDKTQEAARWEDDNDIEVGNKVEVNSNNPLYIGINAVFNTGINKLNNSGNEIALTEIAHNNLEVDFGDLTERVFSLETNIYGIEIREEIWYAICGIFIFINLNNGDIRPGRCGGPEGHEM
jgi:hypothetical protein